jgi:DNA-binding winged helix-turn-helix (wHTH) protein
VRFRFGPFVLDDASRLLTRDGRELRLSRKAFDLLLALVEERPRVLLKDDLRQRLWGGIQVVDANLNNLVSEIRIALGDDSREPVYLRTVHRVGFAFCGEATADAPAPRGVSAAPDARCWLMWGDRRVVLAAGESIVGRDPDCTVWIDASDVSRRHARIDVPAGEAGEVTIEDLASTNGTFVDGRRVTAARPLRDGAVIRMGEATLVFRTRTATGDPTRRVKRRHR